MDEKILDSEILTAETTAETAEAVEENKKEIKKEERP